MDEKKEEHICIKFCFKLNKISTEMLKIAYSEVFISRIQVFYWFANFENDMQ